MKNYNIEGGIDFYGELYKSLDIEENEKKTEDDLMLCLITNKPLTEHYYTMVCGHKFNYLPLYLDIKNHKQKFNGMESHNSKLKQDEIRCPYCRKKQKGVLPYYEELIKEKVNGVNAIVDYENIVKLNNTKPCDFVELDINFDPCGNDIIEVECYPENSKFFKCNRIHGRQIDFNSFIKSKLKNVEYQEMIEDTNYYCGEHATVMKKKYLNKIKYEIKTKDKENKIKENENLKKAKEEFKQKEKQKIRNELKKLVSSSKKNEEIVTDNENIVIGLVDLQENVIEENIIINNLCLEILKSGTKKGECCGCKIFMEKLCKRHYNFKNKIITYMENKSEK